jgi:hypothetical protein
LRCRGAHSRYWRWRTHPPFHGGRLWQVIVVVNLNYGRSGSNSSDGTVKKDDGVIVTVVVIIIIIIIIIII